MEIAAILEINDTGDINGDGEKIMEAVAEVNEKKILLKMSLSTMLDLRMKLENSLGKEGMGFSSNPDDSKTAHWNQHESDETVGECLERRREEVKEEYENYDPEE
jgi:hypothetical protein